YAPAAAMKLEAGRLIVVFTHADTDAEREPTAGEDIERRRLAREERRLARGREHDARHQADALGRPRREREDGHRLQRLRHDAVGDDDAGERAALRAHDPFEHHVTRSGSDPAWQSYGD